jgi:hypothetical protein
MLFPATRTGGHLKPSSLYKPFHKAREAVGLPTLRWHDLRHFAGTTAAQTGASLAELQARLGHSTVNAAMRYQHAAQGRDAAIAEAMSRLAGPDAEAALRSDRRAPAQQPAESEHLAEVVPVPVAEATEAKIAKRQGGGPLDLADLGPEPAEAVEVADLVARLDASTVRLRQAAQAERGAVVPDLLARVAAAGHPPEHVLPRGTVTLSLREAGKQLGDSPATVRALITSGDLVAVRDRRGALRVLEASLGEHLTAMRARWAAEEQAQ